MVGCEMFSSFAGEQLSRDLPLPTGYRDIEDGCETTSMGKQQVVR